ncbi:MAG: XRE family transcriptional regulator [Micromonosporaceae bacterium]|nr:XRE family transcriptional regulator [Micromonosporaceae bacterium]
MVLAARAYVAKSTISDLENARKEPTPDTAKAVDRALSAGGELTGMVTAGAAGPTPPAHQLWEASELLARVRASDVSAATVEALHLTAYDLCRDYSWRDAAELRADGLHWLREVERLLRRPVGLRQHKELLTVAGWLALLVGCVEYDLGMRPTAESTRVAALRLAEEGGNGEIAAWAWEMSAWFALTQGRYPDVLAAVESGRARVGEHTAVVQLLGQEAKARGRMGDLPGVRYALERGRQLLDRFPRPVHPEHHFVVDPDKWDFYAMDAYRLAGDDEPAQHHAEEVLRLGTASNGTERAPMRMAEARLTLGAVAARAGELEQAVDVGLTAFHATRRSLPSLLMVAREVAAELRRRDPPGRPWNEFREAVRSVAAGSAE